MVTPDFEVVLFPTGDDDELVHDLDRFCQREAFDSILRFRLTDEGVRRALRGGLSLVRLLGVLENHARAPIPQNVRFSIEDWAKRAGLLRLDADLRLVGDEPEVLARLQTDPGARKYVRKRIDERTLQLGGRVTPRRLQALLRELDYLVELVEPSDRKR